MVEQIENWSVLRGEVRTVEDDPQRAGFRRVALSVDAVHPVEGFAPAVDGSEAGKVVEISVPSDAPVLHPGHRIELQARSTPAGLFAHPDKTRSIAGD